MYTEEDLKKAASLEKKRALLCWLIGGIVVLAGIFCFVIGQLNRSETMWKCTVAATILGGGWIIFCYGAAVKPAANYRRHIDFMLHGRQSKTVGILREVGQIALEHEGISCYNLLINIGDVNDPEDDRLLYWDVNRPRPDELLGRRVTAYSNNRFISALSAPEED